MWHRPYLTSAKSTKKYRNRSHKANKTVHLPIATSWFRKKTKKFLGPSKFVSQKVHSRCTCWDGKLCGMDELAGTSLCLWTPAGVIKKHSLSSNCEVWMDMCWRAPRCYSLQFPFVTVVHNLSQSCLEHSNPSKSTFMRLLCVLLLCLTSLLHLARLFENQTLTRQAIISMAEWLNVWFCVSSFWWLKMMSLPWLCPREVWSRLTVSLSCINLRTGCERILIPVIETGISVLFWVEKCSVLLVWGMHRCLLFWGVYLAPMLCSAPGWRWCGFGAGHLWVSGHCCTLSQTPFSDWFLLESETQNLHRHTLNKLVVILVRPTWTHLSIQLNFDVGNQQV